jgi:mitochondrial distribution and morphology protein 10
MYLPISKLEGMHIRRASPAWQYIFSFVSDQRSGRGSAVASFRSMSSSQITAQFQRDVGKYSTEYIVSSDDLLVGFRGLWNFGEDPRTMESTPVIPSTASHDPEDLLSPPINGRLSAGLEMYYGLLNKGGGCIDPYIWI